MDIGSSFVADAESSVLVKPCEGTFDDPAGSAEAAAVFGVAFGEQTLNAEGLERVAMGLRIVSAVRLARVRVFGAGGRACRALAG